MVYNSRHCNCATLICKEVNEKFCMPWYISLHSIFLWKKKFQHYVLCICGSLNYFWTYWTISNGFDRQNRGLKDNYITTVFMKIGSQVGEGDLQVSQPREGLQSKFRSYWTQVEPCKYFPKEKLLLQLVSSYRPHLETCQTYWKQDN